MAERVWKDFSHSSNFWRLVFSMHTTKYCGLVVQGSLSLLWWSQDTVIEWWNVTGPPHMPMLLYKAYLNCNPQEMSQYTSLWPGLSPIDTSTPDHPLMLRKCFTDIAGWTPIQLLHHCAWQRRSYWRYIYLIDWLIDNTLGLEGIKSPEMAVSPFQHTGVINGLVTCPEYLG